ncbi:UNVERIFIED_CONTAM: hypothetical protein IGO34_26480, partial [Salmonella enterica subsp. enterica serovar Weltevreden]
SFIGKRITILGAAFKPDSDDVRDSPALAVARLIGTQGGVVTVTDPEAVDNASRAFPELNFVTDTTEALTGADAVRDWTSELVNALLTASGAFLGALIACMLLHPATV